MQLIQNWLGKLLKYPNYFCYESALVVLSGFSVCYGLRAFYIGGFYLYLTDLRILVERAIPVQLLALLLIGAGLSNILSMYLFRIQETLITTWVLLFLWTILAISFLAYASILDLNALISVYIAVIYSWTLWRLHGSTSPKS